MNEIIPVTDKIKINHYERSKQLKKQFVNAWCPFKGPTYLKKALHISAAGFFWVSMALLWTSDVKGSNRADIDSA